MNKYFLEVYGSSGLKVVNIMTDYLLQNNSDVEKLEKVLEKELHEKVLIGNWCLS